MTMTPLQKLARLQHVHRLLASYPQGHPNAEQLQAEFDRLLASVGHPPPHLMGHTDPEPWAQKFTEHFPHPGITTAYAWFNAVMDTGLSAGRAAGQLEGRQVAAQAVEALISEVQFLLRQVESGRQKLHLIRGDHEDAPPELVTERLRRALEVLGRPLDEKKPAA